MLSKGKHSGQIAFPGGRNEKDDNSYSTTALRETEEEVGIPIANQNVIIAGTPVYIPPSNYLVRPFLGYATGALKFTPQVTEVKSIIEVPLRQLLSTSNTTHKKLSTSYMTNVDVPCFILKGHVVWGATAMMLNEFKQMLIKAYPIS